MRITLYKSSLCPRCYMARKTLFELTENRPEIEIETVDILTSPMRCLRDGVRMIPALKIDDRLLSGVYLTRTAIISFLEVSGLT